MSSGSFLRTEISHNKNFSAGAENVLKYNDSFVVRPDGQEVNFSCSCQGLSLTRCLHSENHFSLGARMVSPARIAETNLLPSASWRFRRPEKRASTSFNRLDHRLAFKALPHKKIRSASLIKKRLQDYDSFFRVGKRKSGESG